MSSDLINAVFEALASGFVCNHLRVLLQHKEVKGVSIASSIFLLVWGLWNTAWYYGSLGQQYSLWCALLMTLANASYVSALLWFGWLRRRLVRQKRSKRMRS